MNCEADDWFDVAVVGLGPVGLSLVHLLAAQGLRVIDIARRALSGSTTKPCAFSSASAVLGSALLATASNCYHSLPVSG